MLLVMQKCSKLVTLFTIGMWVTVKKALLLLTLIVVGIIALSTLSLYTVMQTSYATQVVNTLLNQLTPYQVTAAKASYTPPLQLTLEDVVIGQDDTNTSLPKLTLWLSQQPWQNGKLAFDSILIEGATLNLKHTQSALLSQLSLHQLALKETDISSPGWSARGVNIQIEQPKWQTEDQQLPFGDIQLSAQQLYMHGEALDNLLVDMRYQNQDSTIFGSSFNWRGANISGQAEQYPQGWSLINVTIDKLSLSESQQINPLLTTLANFNLPIYHINSLDILNSSFSYGLWQFKHLDASIEAISLDKPLWQQEQGYASFNADSIRHPSLAVFSPRAKVTFTPNQISVDEFDSDFKQGRVQLQGTLAPQQVVLDQLSITGVKWLEDTEQLAPTMRALLSPLERLSIASLEVNNTQFIQVEQKPYWQVSGLTIEGSDLTLIEQNKLGLFEGQLELSANSASIDKLLTTQAHISAFANQHKFTLERAFVPLEQGYIEANGTWDRSSVSAPWQFSIHADGIPLDQYHLQQYLPFALSGAAEVEVELNGLSGDYSMLSHSLSGQVTAYLRQASLEAKSIDGEQSYQQKLGLDKIQLKADRGRIIVHSTEGATQLAGEMDLTKPQFATLLLKSHQPCLQLWSDLINGANVIKATCDTPKHTEPKAPQAEENQDSEPESGPNTTL